MKTFNLVIVILVLGVLLLRALSNRISTNSSHTVIPDLKTVQESSLIPIPSHSLQAIVVTTANWDNIDAFLQRYARKDAKSPWVLIGNKIPAVVGRNGLAWGSGIPDVQSKNSVPVKKEGDNKAPSGIFSLSRAFGYASPDSVKWIKLPYQQVTTAIKCVDDPQSNYYNQLVDRNQVKPDWHSAEDMKRSDNLYSLGIVIDYNVNHSVRGDGSCIFLHIWKKPSHSTSGCTAIEATQMEMLLKWLDPKEMPVLIQLPQSEYVRLQKSWNLP